MKIESDRYAFDRKNFQIRPKRPGPTGGGTPGGKTCFDWQVPRRDEPDSAGELNYSYIFQLIASLGYTVQLPFLPCYCMSLLVSTVAGPGRILPRA
jgi:hypothetical protein